MEEREKPREKNSGEREKARKCTGRYRVREGASLGEDACVL